MSLANLLQEAKSRATPQLRFRGIEVRDVTDRLLEEAASFDRRLPGAPARAVVRAAKSKIPYKASNTESRLMDALPVGGVYVGGWANGLVFAMPRRLKRALSGRISRTATKEAGAMVRLMQRGLVRAFEGPTRDLAALFPSLRKHEIAGDRSTVLVPTTAPRAWVARRTERFDHPHLSGYLGSAKRTDREVVGFLPHPEIEYLWVQIVRDPSGRAGLGQIVDYAMVAQPGAKLKAVDREQLLQQARAQVAELLGEEDWS